MSIARTAMGCLLGGLLLLGILVLVRPLIFTLAPARDDSNVVVGTAASITQPTLRDVGLLGSHALDGERPLETGNVQITLVVAPAGFGAFSAVNAWSPGPDGCAVEIRNGALSDCTGRSWSTNGTSIPPGSPSLQRFAVVVSDGVITADLTRPILDE